MRIKRETLQKAVIENREDINSLLRRIKILECKKHVWKEDSNYIYYPHDYSKRVVCSCGKTDIMSNAEWHEYRAGVLSDELKEEKRKEKAYKDAEDARRKLSKAQES